MVREFNIHLRRPRIGRLAAATIAIFMAGMELTCGSPVRAATTIGTNITTTGSIGIGNLNPSYGLDVTGTGRFTSNLLAPIWDKGGQVYNVKAYGAVGDGTTDDTSAIQSAINAAQTAGSGATVYFSPGTYLVTKAGSLSGGDAIPGQTTNYALRISSGGMNLNAASGATIRLADNQTKTTPILLIGGNATSFSDVRVSNLTFDGNGTNQPSQTDIMAAVFVIGNTLTNIHIDHIHIKNVKVLGGEGSIKFHFNVNRSSITNSLIEGGTTGVAGILLDGGDSDLIADNIINTPGGNGIFVLANADNGAAANNHIIRNNRVISVAAGYNGIAFNGNYSVITGNNVSMASSGAGAGFGINVDSYNPAGGPYAATNNIVSNNEIAGGFFGIDLDGNSSPVITVTNNSIVGNNIRGGPIRAINLEVNATGNVITGNTVNTSNATAISEDATSTGNVIGNNAYIGPSTTVTLNSTDSTQTIYSGLTLGSNPLTAGTSNLGALTLSGALQASGANNAIGAGSGTSGGDILSMNGNFINIAGQSQMFGIDMNAKIGGSANVTTIGGFNSTVRIDTPNATTLNTAAAIIANGASMSKTGAGNVHNMYGLWATAPVSGDTTNLAIFASGNSEFNGGIRLNTVTAKPGCSSTTRGMQWFTQGAGGVKDNFEVCAKDAADAYSWRTLY